jgi:hypothetical protein
MLYKNEKPGVMAGAFSIDTRHPNRSLSSRLMQGCAWTIYRCQPYRLETHETAFQLKLCAVYNAPT